MFFNIFLKGLWGLGSQGPSFLFFRFVALGFNLWFCSMAVGLVCHYGCNQRKIGMS